MIVASATTPPDLAKVDVKALAISAADYLAAR